MIPVYKDIRVTGLRNPDIMAKADEIRAARDAGAPLSPSPEVLTCYPAFRHAYATKEEYRQLLNDLFSFPAAITLADQFNQVARGSCADNVNLVGLWEKMGDDVRPAFAAALDEFIAEDLNKCMPAGTGKESFHNSAEAARFLSERVVVLKAAIQYGSGIEGADNYFELADTIPLLMRLMGNKDWEDSPEKPAPQWQPS